jgi:hypothetical protein
MTRPALRLPVLRGQLPNARFPLPGALDWKRIKCRNSGVYSARINDATVTPKRCIIHHGVDSTPPKVLADVADDVINWRQHQVARSLLPDRVAEDFRDMRPDARDAVAIKFERRESTY